MKRTLSAVLRYRVISHFLFFLFRFTTIIACIIRVNKTINCKLYKILLYYNTIEVTANVEAAIIANYLLLLSYTI